MSCVEKTRPGVIDMYAASTRNSAGGAPCLNVLDYACMFPGRAAQYHFLYSPESRKLLREPLEKRHGLKFLFSHCGLRGIQLGQSFADKPAVTRLEELFGAKNRVTGTRPGRIAMQFPNLDPAPWAQWRERPNGWAGGVDIYQEIHDAARQIPVDTLPENVEPRRWWRATRAPSPRRSGSSISSVRGPPPCRRSCF